MKNILPFLILATVVFQCHAQTHWGKADPAEFSIRTCPFDSSANAMVLLDSAYVTIERVSNTNSTLKNYDASGTKLYTTYSTLTITQTRYVCYKRILILNKEGISNSNISIPFVTLFNYQQVTDIDAQTLNISDNGKINISKVKDDAIFYDTLVRGAMSNVKFTFADVKEGSIIEYKYTMTVRGTELKDWLFQQQLPVIRSAIALKLPDWVYFDMRFQGYLPLIRDKIEHYNDVWNSVTGIKAHFAMENIPAIKPEPFVANPYDNLNKLRFYPETVKTVNGVSTHTAFRTWQELAKHLSTTGNYFSPLSNVAWGFLAKEVVAVVTDKTEKVRRIYNNLHTIMKWNKQYGITSARLTQGKADNDSIGNSAEINLILLGMLHSAGIRADPVLISTRDHGAIDTSFVNQRHFNNLIVMAELDSDVVLLDAVNPYSPYYLLPENDINGLGLKISDIKTDAADVIKTQWVKINPSSNSATSVSSVIEIDSQGNYKAKSAFTASDYCALLYRDQPPGKTVTEYAKSAFKIADDIDIKNVTTENESDVDKKIRIVFDLEKKNTTPDDSFLYITPFPLKFYSENPLNQKDRVNPISFGWGIQRTLSCSLTLPKNYKLVEPPKQVKFKLDDGSASFTLLVAQTDLNVQLIATFKINSTYYGADMFNDLKTLYAKMIDACNSVIVLQKM